ncbi:MAG: phenylalanine 4-monooxygenase [Calditrichaeota bacterium]|nr:phenylalanine 4-monooxygenase [Calditrichota bacterium]
MLTKSPKNRVRPTKQVYANYTAEDFQVWKTLYHRQMNALKGNIAPEYLDAIKAIGFEAERIPDFIETNQRLEELTGWQLVTVPNICPPKKFFKYLSEKKFTATCWLRTMAELDYIEEPDMFHDVFAHAPLLTNTAYTDFFHQIGILAVQHLDNDEIISKLQRLYWFTIEFGLMKNNDEINIYGAGIISSKGETLNAISDESRKHAFDLTDIFEHEFRNDIIQTDYYVIQSFDQLVDSLDNVKELLG